MDLQQVQDQIVRLGQELRAILDGASADNRQHLTADEKTKFDKIDADRDELLETAKRLKKETEIEASLSQSEGRRTAPATPAPEGTRETRVQSRLRVSREDCLEATRSWLLAGSDQPISDAQRAAAHRAGVSLDKKSLGFRLPQEPLKGLTRDAMREWEERAHTALEVGAGDSGGFTVPDETMRALEVALLQFGGMRQVATVIRTNSGANLPIPTVNDTSNKGEIIGESGEVNKNVVTFAQLVLEAYKYSSKLILVSVEMLQDSSVNVAELLGRLLGERIARITNEHFTTADGSSKPRGVVHASTEGKEGAGGQTTSVIYDDLVDLEHSVDPAYRLNGARWMFADSTLKALKKIKVPQFSGDTAGMPLWQPGMTLGQPDTILGYPYTINQDVAAMAATAKSIVFGDLSKYIIRDVRDVTLLRLDERFAEFHQVAFLAFSRHDGDLLNAGTNPVKHYVNAAS